MMQHSTTTQPQGHGWTRRMRRAFRALVLTGSALALTASVASAKMACNYPPGGGSNTCLTITNLGNGIYSVLVGIDVHESAAEVQRLLNDAQAAGRPLFTALLKADDPGSNDATLSQVPVSWVAGGAGGLSAEFYMLVGSTLLNEDNSWRDKDDEEYALVMMYDKGFPGGYRIFQSGVITDRY